MKEQEVPVELCRRNWAGGGGYAAPTVIEFRWVTETEADRLVWTDLANGYYWRRAKLNAPWEPEEGGA